jgi:hypothetical protein
MSEFMRFILCGIAVGLFLVIWSFIIGQVLTFLLDWSDRRALRLHRLRQSRNNPFTGATC